MVGNLWEFVADWVPNSTACPGWGGSIDDTMCLAGAATTDGPSAVGRGGGYPDGAGAGVFAVSGWGGAPATRTDLHLGFRAAR